jgi:DNA-binding transcriptional LysR family regulator
MSTASSWDDQRIFLAVLDEGSFSGACRKLGLSHPTIRARIAALEAGLGTVLFTRSVNGLTPTEAALALRDAAHAMALASDRFWRQATAGQNEVAGVVRLSVPEFMGTEVIPQMLLPLRRRYPGLRIELSLSNALADLLGQEVDLAVRTTAPTQEALVARKVASIPLGFYAAAEYVALRGLPADLAGLAGHDIVGPDRSQADLALAARLGPGFLRRSFALSSDSHTAQFAAVRAGLGIGVTQVPVGDRTMGLQRVLPDVVVGVLETWVATHENLAGVPRIRAVSDALAEGFRNQSRKFSGPAEPRK